MCQCVFVGVAVVCVCVHIVGGLHVVMQRDTDGF